MNFPGVRARDSVRTRLMLLALVVAIPLTALAGFRAWERHRTEEDRQAEHLSQLATLISRSFDARVEESQTVLQGLTHLLDPSADRARNDSLLVRLYREAPVHFANLWMVDTSGRVVAAARRPAEGLASLDAAAHTALREVVRARQFITTTARSSRSAQGVPDLLTFAMPITDAQNAHVRAVVVASYPVDSLDGVMVARQLPEGSVVTIIDSSRSVVWRTLHPERWVGKSVRDDPRFAADFAAGQGANTLTSIDGIHRLIAFRRIASTGGIIYVGVPTQYSIDLAQSQLILDLVFGGIVSIVVLVVAYLIGRSVLDPIEALTTDAAVIAHGDDSRRSKVSQQDEIGALAHAFNHMADTAMTQRRALEESDARFRTLFDANPLPTLAWSVETGRISDANAAAAMQYGFAREALVGKPVQELVHTSQRHHIEATITSLGIHTDSVEASHHEASHHEASHHDVWLMQHADGHALQMEVHTTPIERGASHDVIMVGIDLGPRRATEQALQESREQLRQAQKMEALGSFAGGVAHDFNNYLSSIIGFTELARTALPADSPIRADLSEALRASNRAADLTRQILLFSRKQVVEPQVLDPTDIVRGLRRLLAPLLGEKIELATDLDHAAGVIRADRGQLEQVLVNLAANARDAMPSGGRFTIRCARRVTSEANARTQGIRAGDWVQLAIEDTGSGIPAEHLERIFEPFFTTKDRGRGTGLGLALVYSIVQQAGGVIRVESEHGVGTRFLLYFPRVAADRAEASGTMSTEPALGGHERILVVEDDDMVRSMTRHVLERAGYEVLVAANAPAALSCLANSPQPAHLLLTDVVMPGVSGPALARRTRLEHPDMHVLYMSGYADDDQLVRAASRDAVAFLAKPFTSDVLLRKVREVLDG